MSVNWQDALPHPPPSNKEARTCRQSYSIYGISLLCSKWSLDTVVYSDQTYSSLLFLISNQKRNNFAVIAAQ